MGGLAQSDGVMMNYMKMAGASKWQIFTKLELPHSLPSLFSGIKISATYAVMGAVVAEWIGADKGIGYYMLLQKSAYRTDRMFVAIVIIVLLSLVLLRSSHCWKNGLYAGNHVAIHRKDGTSNVSRVTYNN